MKLFILFVLLSFNCIAIDLTSTKLCSSLFTINRKKDVVHLRFYNNKIVPDNISLQLRLTDDTYSMEEYHLDYPGFGAKRPLFKAVADLDDGILSLNFITKLTNGNRSSFLQGGAQFDFIMLYFGEQVKRIHAHWTPASQQNEPNTKEWAQLDNIEQFNHAISEGYDEYDAAFQTWTGKQALRYGYNYVEDLGKGMSFSEEGELEYYDELEFEFYKEE